MSNFVSAPDIRFDVNKDRRPARDFDRPRFQFLLRFVYGLKGERIVRVDVERHLIFRIAGRSDNTKTFPAAMIFKRTYSVSIHYSGQHFRDSNLPSALMRIGIAGNALHSFSARPGLTARYWQLIQQIPHGSMRLEKNQMTKRGSK